MRAIETKWLKDLLSVEKIGWLQQLAVQISKMVKYCTNSLVFFDGAVNCEIKKDQKEKRLKEKKQIMLKHYMTEKERIKKTIAEYK